MKISVSVTVWFAVVFVFAHPAAAWKSYVHQRLAWVAMEELKNTPIAIFENAVIFGANEPDDHKGLRDHSQSFRRAQAAFNASVGAFERGCMQESARRLGHSFHYLEDLGCSRKPFGNRIKNLVENIAYTQMKETESSQFSTASLRETAQEYRMEELSGAATAEAVLSKLAEARQEFENMIRYIEKEYEDQDSRNEAYDFVVRNNLAVTLGAMMQLAEIYKNQTYQLWISGRVSSVCRCLNDYNINWEGNDCFYKNRPQVIDPPPWSR